MINQTLRGGLSRIGISTLQFVSLVCVLLLVGCATYSKEKQEKGFDDITEAYGNSIRWGKFELANGLRADEEKGEKPDFEALKNVRITSYELKAVNVSADGDTVQQDVEIQYYKTNQLIEKTLIDRQLWKYDKEAKRWRLHTALPDFK